MRPMPPPASTVQDNNRPRGEGRAPALNNNSAAASIRATQRAQLRRRQAGQRPNQNRNVPPSIAYVPTPPGMDNGVHEAESLAAAQEFGYLWLEGSGYDGPFLPEPSLIAVWYDEAFAGQIYAQPPLQQNYVIPNTGMFGPFGIIPPIGPGNMLSEQDMIRHYGRNALLEHHNNLLRSFGAHNVVLPPLPRHVGGVPGNEYLPTDSRVLPSMGLFLGWTIGNLPELSQRYLAYHLKISHHHYQNNFADPTYRSPVHNGSPYLGVPFSHMYTMHRLSRTRFFNSGPTEGFQSFGELTQVDMPSSSIGHFSIMAHNQRTVAAAQQHWRNMNVPRQNFNIFQELVKRPELVIIFAKHLRVQELLILYSMSIPFNNIVSSRITTVIISQALTRAPDSARIFPFRCYEKLCIPDPGLRLHPIPGRALAGELRKVPSFRWLRMICYREMVCHDIMTIMAEDGVPIPPQCEPVIKKIWLLMDIPDNVRRIGLVQNSQIFTDEDLFFALLFFVKMDMRFTDPITGSGKDGMRRLMMSQPGMTVFWKSLKRTTLKCKMDVIRDRKSVV